MEYSPELHGWRWPPVEALQDPEHHRHAMRGAYYDCFAAEPTFWHELQALANRLLPFLPEPRTRLNSDEAATICDEINRFLTQWPLGNRGFMDIWSTFMLHPNPPAGTALWQGPRPFDAQGLKEKVYQEDGQVRLSFPMIQPRHDGRPIHFPPFPYDPTAPYLRGMVNTPAEVRKRAKAIADAVGYPDIEQDIVGQAVAIEDRANGRGWKAPARRYKKPDELPRLAWRLYARAVKGWKWPVIASVETAARQRRGDLKKPISPDTVRLSVSDLARELGVPLP
jgi:hypothetical protein